MFLNWPVLYRSWIASEMLASLIGVFTSKGTLSNTNPGSTRFNPWTLISEIVASSANVGRLIEISKSNNKIIFFIYK